MLRRCSVCSWKSLQVQKGCSFFLMAEQVQYAPGILCRCSTTMFAPFCLWLFFAPFIFETKTFKFKRFSLPKKKHTISEKNVYLAEKNWRQQCIKNNAWPELNSRSQFIKQKIGAGAGARFFRCKILFLFVFEGQAGVRSWKKLRKHQGCSCFYFFNGRAGAILCRRSTMFEWRP